MSSKDYKSAEYDALHRVVTADKRFRRFQYALTFILFLLIIAGGWNIQQSIAHKIDGLVDGSVARGNARQLETKTIARESIRYNTCLLVIEPVLRSAEVQQRCFEAADLPGGLTRSDFSPVILNPDGTVALANEALVQSQTVSDTPSVPQQPSGQSSNTSSTQSTPAPQPSQPNNQQATPQRTTIQRVEDATAKAVDFLWPFN